MNVLSVIHYPFFGGPQNRTALVAPRLVFAGVHTTAVLPDESGNAADRLRGAGVEVLTMPLHRLRANPNLRLQLGFLQGYPVEVRQLRRLIRRRDIDLVQLNDSLNAVAALAARLEHKAIVWMIEDTRLPLLLRRAWTPVLVELADVIMTTGTGMARFFPGISSLQERWLPYYPAVDTARFRVQPELRSIARRKLGIPDEALVVGTVANLAPQKGLEYFLEAAQQVHVRLPEVCFAMLGATMATQERYARRIRGLARATGLTASGRLVLHDPGQEVAEYLRAFDIFVLTSVPRSEGTPATIAEAMATSIPVVSTDVGAVRELVEDGVTGLVVPPLDAHAIASAILRLLGDGAMRQGMGEAARRRAMERFDISVCAGRHLEAFELAIRHRASSSSTAGGRC